MDFTVGAPAFLRVAIAHLGVQHGRFLVHARAFAGGFAINSVLAEKRAADHPVGEGAAGGDERSCPGQLHFWEKPLAT